MSQDTDSLINGLVEDLSPRKPLRFATGMVLAAVALAAAIVLAILPFGMRADLAAGRPDAMFILSGGIVLMLGLACTASAVAMSNPRVGAGRQGWGWAVACAALLPFSALVVALLDGRSAWARSVPDHGLVCFPMALALGLTVGTTLVVWLRRGAPASPRLAGLLTGISAGSAGVFAFTFVCPENSLLHIGLWHGLPVALSALLGRLVVPPLIRW